MCVCIKWLLCSSWVWVWQYHSHKYQSLSKIAFLFFVKYKFLVFEGRRGHWCRPTFKAYGNLKKKICIHTSNTVAFDSNCVYPNKKIQSKIFETALFVRGGIDSLCLKNNGIGNKNKVTAYFSHRWICLDVGSNAPNFGALHFSSRIFSAHMLKIYFFLLLIER